MFLNETQYSNSLIDKAFTQIPKIYIFFFFVIDVFAWHQYLANKKNIDQSALLETVEGKGGTCYLLCLFLRQSCFTILTVGFQCQAIHKKFLHRFGTRFETKMIVKIYAIEIIFKSHGPFQSYKLTGPENSASCVLSSTRNPR